MMLYLAKLEKWMQKYTLELTEVQIYAIARSCELYSRLAIGQSMGGLECLPWDHEKRGSESHLRELHRLVTDYLRTRKPLKMGVDGWTASLGIGNRETPQDAKVAYDIKKCIDRAMDEENSPYHQHIVPFGEEPLITITRVEE